MTEQSKLEAQVVEKAAIGEANPTTSRDFIKE